TRRKVALPSREEMIEPPRSYYPALRYPEMPVRTCALRLNQLPILHLLPRHRSRCPPGIQIRLFVLRPNRGLSKLLAVQPARHRLTRARVGVEFGVQLRLASAPPR